MILFRHELRQGRRMLLIWSAVVGFMILICMLMYPEMGKQMGDIDKIFSQMGGFTEAFGMDKLSLGSVMGFYGIECGNVLGIGGSLGKLLGPTGGYRYGFAAAAILTSLFCRKVKNLKAQTAFLVFAGIPVIYLFGAVQMKAVTKQPWQAIMVQAVLPFIPLDVVKCFVAAGIAKILRRVVPQF